MTVVETLAKLVAIDSVSAKSNIEIISFIVARCESLGFGARLLPYTDARGVEKLQMIACAPRETRDEEVFELALVGHTDTVPFDPVWAEALTLTERDARLYGRGACDTKAFIAAALAACARFDLNRLKRPLALVATADEEIGCLGAKRLADAKALRARYAVVGEPTSLRPVRAGKGYCLAEVTVGGREGHSAFPARGANAIFRAARLLARIEAVADELKTAQHAAFDPPHTTVNVGLIDGGTAKNIIPARCRFTLEWRPVPGQAATHALDLIKAEVDHLRAMDADFDCHIDVLRLDGGMETEAASPLVRHLEAATGKSAGTVAFGTEAPQLAEMGAQAVVFGPGNIAHAHRTGEFVPGAELADCVEILAGVIERFCY